MEDQEATPEQRKAIAKILFKAKLALFFTGIKFSIGLFASNLISILIGMYFLKDVDADTLVGFQFVSMFANFIFMTVYLNGQLRKNSDIVVNKIKEVLKKQ